MNRFAGTTEAEDRAAMALGLRDAMRFECGRLIALLSELDEWAWSGIAHPEYRDLEIADVALVKARADTLDRAIAPLLPAADAP